MIDRHITLGYMLSEATGVPVNRIHWQPGPDASLKYPCILYEFSRVNTINADDKNYVVWDSYSITHIYKDDKNSKVNEMLNFFEYISLDSRQRVEDGLYHDYYTVFY